MPGESNEESVDYDTITGRPKMRTGPSHPTSPTSPKPNGGGRPHPGAGGGGTDSMNSTAAGTSTGQSQDGTAAACSVGYDTINDGSGHNVDADQQTALGIEIKERFRTMRAAFLKMDTNRDGRITKKEVLEMCRNWNIPAAEAERVLRAADLDHNGTLDFNEFAQRFDPYDGAFGDDSASLGSTNQAYQGVGHDDRPIRPTGGAADRPIKTSGWSMSADEAPADTTMPSSRGVNAGCGAHGAAGPAASAARALRGDEGSLSAEEVAALRARNAELEAELSRTRARVAELEEENHQLRVSQASPSPGGAANGSRDGRDVIDRGGEGAARAARDLDRTNVGNQAQAQGQVAEADDTSPTTVYVYGKTGDKKTDEMYKALRGAGIPFERRDFDKDKRFMDALAQSGFGGGSLSAPVVCLGLRAWWDDPAAVEDAMFSIPFGTGVAMELRHDLGVTCGNAASQAQVPVRMDADIDTEIAERFSSMQQAFLKVDEDRDGFITIRELLQKCKEWNIPGSEAQRALGEADTDLDGTISFAEFAVRFNSAAPRGMASSTGSRPKSQSGGQRAHGARHR